MDSRTLVETDCCPEELCRGIEDWSLQELEVEDLLGSGRISSVVQCKCKRTGWPVALKVYHKQGMTMQHCLQVAREIAIHSCQEHSNILGLYAAFEDLDGIYLVQELAPGRDLYRLLGTAGGYLAEEYVSQMVVPPLLAALTVLHAQGIIHRDIKPENILLAEDGTIRLADFGLAIDTTQEAPRSRVGTLDYFAPEIVEDTECRAESGKEERRIYGPGIDIWAAGILAYELLLGGPPFEADTKAETYQRILHTEPFYPSLWSQEAVSFLAQALTKDPGERPTAEALLQHPWLLPPKDSTAALPPTTHLP